MPRVLTLRTPAHAQTLDQIGQGVNESMLSSTLRNASQQLQVGGELGAGAWMCGGLAADVCTERASPLCARAQESTHRTVANDLATVDEALKAKLNQTETLKVGASGSSDPRMHGGPHARTAARKRPAHQHKPCAGRPQHANHRVRLLTAEENPAPHLCHSASRR